jgi:hypothetical protein
MPFQATVLKVMIASPGDVNDERQIVREEVYEWNHIHTNDRKLVLLPIGWETHSTPSLGERGQSIINREVLAGCDLLIAMFWKRIGTPTGDYASGTVEEIKEHVKAGKPAMLYFSSAPVPQEVIEDKHRLKQYQDLLRFKAECFKDGLVESYDSLDDFRDKLARQLAQKINLNYPSDPINAGASSMPPIASALSKEATSALIAATARDADGQIMRLRTSEGLHVQAGGKNLVPESTPRTEARWEHAVDELAKLGLIRGSDGEIYDVTPKGYEVADQLRPTPVHVGVTLSTEAKELMTSACEAPGSRAGLIVISRTNRGNNIYAGSRPFVNPDDPRSEATWVGAVNELSEHSLIEPMSPKNEIYKVTREGWKIFDEIKPNKPPEEAAHQPTA